MGYNAASNSIADNGDETSVLFPRADAFYEKRSNLIIYKVLSRCLGGDPGRQATHENGTAMHHGDFLSLVAIDSTHHNKPVPMQFSTASR
jgi:hypothetical protein